MSASATEPVDIPFFEVTDGEGELRTKNQPDQVQRESVTDRGRETRFKVQTTLHACVHGTLDSTSNPRIPASIIVLEYRLKSLEAHSAFENIYTELRFRDKKGETTPTSLPNVKRLEPFWDSERWNITTEEEFHSWYSEATVGGGVGPVTLEGTVGGERGSAHEQKYFIEGDAGRHFKQENQTYDRAWWNIKQNRSQEDGIPRNFRVAVLLQRSSDADFEATFSLEVKAGFRYKASNVWEWCRGKAERDDPMLFRPTQPAQGDIRGIDDANNLGAVNLALLCPVWGLAKNAN